VHVHDDFEYVSFISLLVSRDSLLCRHDLIIFYKFSIFSCATNISDAFLMKNHLEINQFCIGNAVPQLRQRSRIAYGTLSCATRPIPNISKSARRFCLCSGRERESRERGQGDGRGETRAANGSGALNNSNSNNGPPTTRGIDHHRH